MTTHVSRATDDAVCQRSPTVDAAADSDAFESFVEIRHGGIVRHSASAARRSAARQAEFERAETDFATVKDKWRAAMIKRSSAGSMGGSMDSADSQSSSLSEGRTKRSSLRLVLRVMGKIASKVTLRTSSVGILMI
uniref:Uncharacterized protein n=1 Tax=Hemiselmis andersenii TaxID=464988 RepID=A0A7S1EKF0_HEMAN|mmetsp:Transcript_53110/g.128630  ORF Transcript_53110/g.128630 Transcript_53110/m.128630 type:complete len:136 (+) Transcript_53110:52-459(+)|eukprot:CAMPEP_0114124068 /NCGR_PEP_ID=MMETSP0043_2-20121206/8583_1 /TAXON_ID=464988 /ORGANISM="Hemiselmis andersenii, Strain CCMP644" /LENGTH=135 /DNA_ID=CAMNT_0001216929 /DNA_START=32 /DNA_END=439 /DNA_ORIENTATION=+